MRTGAGAIVFPEVTWGCFLHPLLGRGRSPAPAKEGHNHCPLPAPRISNQTGESPSLPLGRAWPPPWSVRGPGRWALNRKPHQSALHHPHHPQSSGLPFPLLHLPSEDSPPRQLRACSLQRPTPWPPFHDPALGAHGSLPRLPLAPPPPQLCAPRVPMPAIRKGDQHTPTPCPAIQFMPISGD